MVQKPSYQVVVAEASLPKLPDSATFDGTFQRLELKPGGEKFSPSGDRLEGNESTGGKEHGGNRLSSHFLLWRPSPLS